MSTKPSRQNNHKFFMELAYLQAKKVLGNTKENPAVGCIIVKDNQVISAAHTSIDGRPHAEKNALYLSQKNSINASLYVTLEPCSHYGKTGPCTLLIKKHKIKKVFYSMNDPDYRTFNKSELFFKTQKIILKKNILNHFAMNFYKSYINSKNKALPYVMAKLAVSKDFYTIDLRRKWITNEFSRKRVHLLRGIHDCLLTSAATINKDNPSLTTRISGLEYTTPICIIIDKNLNINVNSNIVNNAKKRKTIIFYQNGKQKIINLLNKKKVKLIKFNLESDKKFNLVKLLYKIKSLGYSRIFLESGLNLTKNFLKNKLINDFSLFISSNNLGRNGLNKFVVRNYLIKKKKFLTENVNLFGDKFVSYNIK